MSIYDYKDDFYRIAERELLQNSDFYYLCNEHCTIDEDSFEFHQTGLYKSYIKYVINAKVNSRTLIERGVNLYNFIDYNTPNIMLPEFTKDGEYYFEIEFTIVYDYDGIEVSLALDDLNIYSDKYGYQDYLSKHFASAFNHDKFNDFIKHEFESTGNEILYTLSRIIEEYEEPEDEEA